VGTHGLSLLRLTFLGTSAAQPTINRNLSGLALRADADLVLFDCGEGTQRQMLRFGTGFSLTAVFFTHFHADHYLGIIGFLRTLAMMGRADALAMYGPPPARTLLDRALHLGIDALSFPVHIRELGAGDEVRPGAGAYTVRAVAADHRVPGLGYVVDEDARPGRFDIARARALGVPEGPAFGQLQRGEDVTVPGSGRVVAAAEVLGPGRPGRRVALSGDTRPTAALAEAARGADLLIHEATFADDERERALLTKHSTAREAGAVASEAGAARLVLTHLSSRHDLDGERLRGEAAATFAGRIDVAHDGLEIEVPMRGS
jgi:ribonuclease Z